MTESGKGVLALIGACAVWGLSPLFFKALSDVPTLEVLAHRALWALVVFGFILGAQHRLHEVVAVLRDPSSLVRLLLASAMILSNWSLYIWSVQTGHTIQSSLGYYIFPLVSVLLGIVVLGEGLDMPKGAAIVLASLAVLVLTWGLGVAPWVSLVLATTFGIYGLLKKFVYAGPVVSVTAEVLVVAPFALIFLALAHGGSGLGGIVPTSGSFGRSLGESALLVFAGPLTALPLVLFSYGARRVTMATTGLVQYLNPSLQFAIAALIFAEPVTRWHAIAFPLIWAALAIYSARAFVQDRSLRKASISAGTSSTAVK